MTAIVLDGAAIAEKIRAEVAVEVKTIQNNGKNAPGLATVLVGENPASSVYVRAKQKACLEVGIQSFGYNLPVNSSQGEVEDRIKRLNDDPLVNGILVQLPLPSGLDEEKILNTIRIDKDVDGTHPLNIGRLAQKGREPLFVPCTPEGVMYLLERALPDMSGKNAVVLGRSNIVGMPVALLLIRANATVTVCHSHSLDLPVLSRTADILVTAIGKAEMVRGDWIKPGAVVIDAGINRVEDAARPKGYRLTGDVAYREALEVASAITPVPGGVGPMRIAMLLQNTVRAARF